MNSWIALRATRSSFTTKLSDSQHRDTFAEDGMKIFLIVFAFFALLDYAIIAGSRHD